MAYKIKLTAEEIIYRNIAVAMKLTYPTVIYRFDYGAGTKLSYKQAVIQKMIQKERGFPDLVIFAPCTGGEVHGLCIEIKVDGTRIKKKDGSYASDHIQEQFEMLYKLREAGYCAAMTVGFDETWKLIVEYLEKTFYKPVRKIRFTQ